jgi:hypothetical protein
MRRVRSQLDGFFAPDAPSGLEHKHLNHTARYEGQLDSSVRTRIFKFVSTWQSHTDYWSTTPLPTLVCLFRQAERQLITAQTLRYEDIAHSPLSVLTGLLRFLLDEQDMPSLDAVACALELRTDLEPYESAKVCRASVEPDSLTVSQRPLFSSWDQWEPSLRLEVLQAVRFQWCRFGFDRDLKNTRAKDDIPTEIYHLCDDA